MQISADQLAVDRDRQFDDWGETITFREVTQTYTPETQQVAEASVDTPITAIVGSGASTPSPGTAAQHFTDDISFLVRAEDLPTSSPTPTSRIVYNGTQYDILRFSLSAQNLIYTLLCRKTN